MKRKYFFKNGNISSHTLTLCSRAEGEGERARVATVSSGERLSVYKQRRLPACTDGRVTLLVNPCAVGGRGQYESYCGDASAR